MAEQIKIDINQVVDYSQHLVNEGKLDAALSVLYQVLKSNPEYSPARAKLRELIEQAEFVGASNLAKNLEKFFMSSAQHTLERSSEGWRYVLALDNSFINENLKKPDDLVARKERRKEENVVLKTAPCSAADYLQAILNIPDMKERWDYCKTLMNETNNVILGDDFTDVSPANISQQLSDSLKGGELNILILGAGCIGLVLANALKLNFADKVNILIVESRVQATHVKVPYSRDWLTHIPNAVLHGLYDDEVTSIVRDFGKNGFMGASLDIFETLFMLSNKKLGVKFYYDDEYDLSFVKDSGTHMIFDATGGRFKMPMETQTEQVGTLRIEKPNKIPDEFSINLPEAPSFGKGHATHGITKVIDFRPHTVQVKKTNGCYDVYHDGKMMKVALFKVTNVPIEHYEALINFTAPINQDSCFYTWPGNLRDGLNKLLLLINLEQPGYETLCHFLPESMSLRDFGAKGGFDLEAVDKRILDYLKIVYDAGTDIDQVMVEPPFLYTPSMGYLGEPFKRLYDRQLIPVGDSIYLGHPKVGNGLGGHLSFIRYVLDAMLYLYATR